MGSIFMGIGNIVVFKPSPYYSSSAREAAGAEGAYIDIWESIVEDRRGEERRYSKRLSE